MPWAADPTPGARDVAGGCTAQDAVATAAPIVAPEGATAPDPVTASTVSTSSDPAALRVAPGPPAPREAAAPDGLALDPAGYRLRVVRDAAATLSLVLGAILVLSLVARPAPAGEVPSATDLPGGAAGDPGGAPGVLAPAGGGAAGRAGDGAASGGTGRGIAPLPAPGGTSGPTPIPTRTPGASASVRPVP
jgi:hypothetical protein